MALPDTQWCARSCCGGLVVGVLDLLDAFIFFGLRSGARPIGILHSIAAGSIGRDAARAGGTQTAALGVLLHFPIAFIITAVYVVASRVLPVLRKRWVLCGLAFGVLAYFVMTLVVVPLSNAGPGRITFALPVDAGPDQRHRDSRLRRRIAGRLLRVSRPSLIPDDLMA